MLRGGRRLLLILGIVVLVSTVLLFSGSSDDAPRKRRYTPPDQNIETERKEEEDEEQEIEQDNSDKSEGDEVDKDQTEGDQDVPEEEKPKETENKEDQESNEPDTQTQDEVTSDNEQKESDNGKPEEDESEEAKQHEEDEENGKQDGKPGQTDEPPSEQTTNNNDDNQQTDPQTSTEEEDAGSTTTPSQDDVTQTIEEEDKKDNETVSADELEKEEDEDDITLDAESSNNNDTDPHSADTETTPQPKSEEEQAKPKKHFLIRGYPRSGTNWVSNVYNLHPKVSSTGELNLESSLWQLMQDFQQNSGLIDTYKDSMMDKVYASIRTLIFNMMDALPLHWSKMELLNKNPATADTIEWVGDHSPQSMTFLDYVPEMKVVFIVRDPRDVAISYFFLHLTSCCKAKDEFCYRFVQLADEHEEEFQEEWDKRMEVHCANQSYYDYHPEKLLVPVDSYWIEHIMAEWRERVEDYEDRLRLRGDIHLVKYEDLWNNFDEERVKLFAFLGLDDKEALPASYETKTKPGFPTNATDGFFRKGMIGDWKRWDEVASAEAIDGATTSTGGLLGAGATKVAAASLCKFGYLPPARCGSTEATTTATTPTPPPSNPLDMED